LDQKQPVIITVVNVSGEVVNMLFKEELPGGNYQFEFKTNKLNPGIYMLQVLAGEREVTKKIVVSR